MLVILLYALSILFMAGLFWGLDGDCGILEGLGRAVMAIIWPLTLLMIVLVLIIIAVFSAGYKTGEWLNSRLYGVAK